jgi:tRNA pseudouridine65 synthase
MNLQILYHDPHLLIVDKPAWMLVHRGIGSDRVVLVDLVRELLQSKKVHPLHRLDRQTSGPVAFALTEQMARIMNRQFASGRITKQYIALVRGEVPLNGVINSPVPGCENCKRVDAITEFESIECVQSVPRETSLVKLYPKTGRFHQIRRHLKHINHPVIGDANYGKGALNRAFKQQYGLMRMALHCTRLSFIHPVSDTAVTAVSPVPEDMAAPLKNMGFTSVN